MLLKKHNGMTLIELLITISIVAIVINIALPSFLSVIQKNKKSTLQDELLSALQFTRSTSTISRSSITICGIDDTTNADCSSNWEKGWIIFTDRDNNGIIDGTDNVISIKNDIPSDILLQATTTHITYDSQGIADGFRASLEFCNRSSNANDTAFGIYISNFGYVRATSSTADLIGCP